MSENTSASKAFPKKSPTRKLMKIILIIAVVWVSLVILVAVGTLILDHIGSDMHGELKWTRVSDSERSQLVYHGNNYYPTNTWLESDITDQDVEIGWQYGFLFPNFYYYTDGSENPVCILSKGSVRTREVYLRSDCDFKAEAYIVEDTDIEFVFSQGFIKSAQDMRPADYSWGTDVVFSLKDEPRLKIYVSLYQSDDTWYFLKNGECWILSEELASTLKSNHII